MYKLPKSTRDEIVRWLRIQLVPAEVGAGMIQIVNILSGLEEIKEKEDVKTPNIQPKRA